MTSTTTAITAEADEADGSTNSIMTTAIVASAVAIVIVLIALVIACFIVRRAQRNAAPIVSDGIVMVTTGAIKQTSATASDPFPRAALYSPDTKAEVHGGWGDEKGDGWAQGLGPDESKI